MQFEYVPYSGSWLPLVPVVFRHRRNRLPPIRALIDTGATHSILPAELAQELGIALDLEQGVESQVAGGGQCFIYPSPVPLDYGIQDRASGVDHRWSGAAFFALGQQFVLLGHDGCLSKFDILFKGPERFLELTPRF